MTTAANTSGSIAVGDEKSSQSPMMGDASSPPLADRSAPAFPQDPRQLVRLIQCPQCSKPFTAPVTLPCGHAVCLKCLPEPRTRSNISYPDLPHHQLGIDCPVCGQQNSPAECNVDVTFAKLMELIKDAIWKHAALQKDSPTLLEEVVRENGGPMSYEVEPKSESRCGIFDGGRLAATFQMAMQGQLTHSSDVTYQSQVSTGEDHAELDIALFDNLGRVAQRELDCLVCYNPMLDPTTTPCGHTFCRQCLMRVMDHSSICPVCRRNLHIPASLDGVPSNKCLGAIFNILCPKTIAARRIAFHEEQQQPGDTNLETPLFVCTLSLPTTPTILHIFEPRYRLMMRRCLEGNRRFGMLMSNRGAVPQGDLGVTEFLEYGTLLQIIKYEMLPDGRSFVETRGISRFRVLEHGMLDGYHVGHVERVDDVSLSQEQRLEAIQLGAAQAQAAEYNREHHVPLTSSNYPELLTTLELYQRCRDYVMSMRSRSTPWLSQSIVNVYGECPEDPAIFPYWFASVVPIALEEKYLLLRTTTVRERLRIVYSWIRRIERQRW